MDCSDEVDTDCKESDWARSETGGNGGGAGAVLGVAVGGEGGSVSSRPSSQELMLTETAAEMEAARERDWGSAGEAVSVSLVSQMSIMRS